MLTYDGPTDVVTVGNTGGSAIVISGSRAVSIPSTLDVTGAATFAGDAKTQGAFRFNDIVEVTIATGAVTVTKNVHYIDTEGDAASDDLNTISGGAEGQLLIFRVAANGRAIVFKHGTGNIFMGNGADITIADSSDVIMLAYYAGSWHVLSSLV